MKQIFFSIKGLCIFLAVPFFLGALLFPASVKADQTIVIVIDPGHGVKNLGAQYEGYTEKDMTMITAKAMKEELEKYEGVAVYLTHEEDADMSIKDRALFAKNRDADFLFCLHYNMSEYHTLFGSEVWVPAQGEYYAKGYSFAQIQMKEFSDIGLNSRGIKTRLNDRDENYYGILRYCTQENVPSVLIEHCHLDHDKDKPFYQQGEEQLKEFGRMDAAAVAKYFGLKSSVLNVDYSDFPVPETKVPASIVRPDKTEPELCRIEVSDIDQETGQVTVRMEAWDGDSYILYYNYSLDGGNTFTLPEPWPRPDGWNKSAREHTFAITVPFDQPVTLVAGASNGYDVWAQSGPVSIDPVPDPERLREEERIKQEKALREAQKQYQEITYEDTAGQEEAGNINMVLAVLIGIIVLCMLFVSFFMARAISSLLKGNKKR
ncbi:MAG: N-acetylmuramoyl-L-alanine amidase [Lachnospiraceae bacterium]|nr:N-acetylmuramoyl-L-alanine amidase [Lachnospiraceae bacterium]